MKKAVVLVLMVLFLSVNVLALEKTRIFGTIAPNAEVKLKLTYYADSIAYTDQPVSKNADSWGLWEYKMSSDMGTIGLTVISGGIEKSFEVPSGSNFEVKLADEAPVEEASASINNTEEVAAEEPAASETAAEPEKSSASGFAIFGEGNSTSLGIFVVFIGLFITIIIANLVSHGIINLAGRKQETISRPVNTVKLSDRIKEQRDVREKDEQEIRRQREYIEQQNKKREKEEQIRQLQERLDELERDE